jgi:hypothetical protein
MIAEIDIVADPMRLRRLQLAIPDGARSRA